LTYYFYKVFDGLKLLLFI